MKKLYLLVIVIFPYVEGLLSQESLNSKISGLEIEFSPFYKTEIGKTYQKFKLRGGGGVIIVQKSILNFKNTSILLGGYDMFGLNSGKGFITGGSGVSISNKLGAYVGSNFFFKQRKSFFNFGVYIGWENLTRKGSIDNVAISLNETYKKTINQLATDIEFKFGHSLNSRIDLTTSSIFEITKLVNLDEVIEYPNVSFCIGIRFRPFV